MKCAVQGCTNKSNERNKFNGIIFINGKEQTVTTYTCDPCYKALTENTSSSFSIGEIDATATKG